MAKPEEKNRKELTAEIEESKKKIRQSEKSDKAVKISVKMTEIFNFL
ncbi:MAG TPA: hypothetical protein H9671_10905 [Firmicutes bacterium]|nr:hypothetical protein [Bacillota bacterium]